MKHRLMAVLTALVLTSSANAVIYTNIVNPPGSALIGWIPSPSQINGYYVYQGDHSGVYTNRTFSNGAATNIVITIPRGVTTYVALTAYDGTLESVNFSNEITVRPKDPPVNGTLNPAVILSVVTRPSGAAGPWTELATLPLPANAASQLFDTKLGILLADNNPAPTLLSPQAKAVAAMRAIIQHPPTP